MAGTEWPTRESVYRCVADERRRCILTYLQNTGDGTVAVDDLVDYVVEQETNSPAPNRKNVAISLYHVHLPMLADIGVIDYDRRTETIRYRTHQKIEQVIDAA